MHSWELVEGDLGILVGINTVLANKLRSLQRAGVEMLAYQTELSPQRVDLRKAVSVIC